MFNFIEVSIDDARPGDQVEWIAPLGGIGMKKTIEGIAPDGRFEMSGGWPHESRESLRELGVKVTRRV